MDEDFLRNIAFVIKRVDLVPTTISIEPSDMKVQQHAETSHFSVLGFKKYLDLRLAVVINFSVLFCSHSFVAEGIEDALGTVTL